MRSIKHLIDRATIYPLAQRDPDNPQKMLPPPDPIPNIRCRVFYQGFNHKDVNGEYVTYAGTVLIEGDIDVSVDAKIEFSENPGRLYLLKEVDHLHHLNSTVHIGWRAYLL